MRWWRLALVVLTAALAAVAATVLAVAVTVATGGGTARWFPTMDQHPLRWAAAATGAIAVAAVLGWAAQRWYERSLKAQVPAVHQPEPWVVNRPAEVDQIVSAHSDARRASGSSAASMADAACMICASHSYRVERAWRSSIMMRLGRFAGLAAWHPART